jgi:predicted ester cyclase
MDRTRFKAYVDTFNAKDIAALADFYDPDVILELPTGIARGRDGILERYRTIFRYIDERLDIGFLAVDGDRIAAEFLTEFRCHTDYPEFPEMALRSGDVLLYSSFIFYEVADGRFRRIRAALYRADSSRVLSRA